MKRKKKRIPFKKLVICESCMIKTFLIFQLFLLLTWTCGAQLVSENSREGRDSAVATGFGDFERRA